MKNFALCLVFALMAATAARAEYVRKTVRPGFFIPSKELNRREKLPPFPVRPQIVETEEEEDINYVIAAPTAAPATPAPKPEYQVVDEQTPAEKVHVNLLQVRPMDDETIDKERLLPRRSNEKFDDTLGQTATYQKIRQDYPEDLKVIAETGKAPENAAVSAALQKMNSNDSIWVDDSFGIETEEEIAPQK